MIRKFPAWQYILLAIVIIFSIIYALPNIYGEDPCVQISFNNDITQGNSELINNNLLNEKQINSTADLLINKLAEHKVKYKKITINQIPVNSSNILIHFFNPEQELIAKELIQEILGDSYTVALNLVTSMPNWLRYLGAKPMKLGLDLRGGVRFLMAVDLDNIAVTEDNSPYQYKQRINNPSNEIKNSIMERTLQTIRNRVNELGVAEPIVQRQGSNHIVVEIPGLQDTSRAKNILGKTATLNFVMVDQTGVPGPGNRTLTDRKGRKILVKKKIILTGDSIIWANSGFDSTEHRAIVSLRLLNDHRIDLFKKTTLHNIGQAMAIIYKENKIIEKNSIKIPIVEEKIISVATIQSPLGDSFQITGLNLEESRDLALLLKSGAMPATVSIVEERIIGPSLGQENIRMGIISVIIGLSLVLILMLGYYSLFGVIANITLLFNLILLIAGMSLIEATLTLPGIAGIVLTLGMAVDANVLIFERIREELKHNTSNILSIHRGFECAFATIMDSNLTTLIVGIILFFIGTGPVKGFAVVLSIGILTSLFTAITGTRAIISILYERKKPLKKIWIGI